MTTSAKDTQIGGSHYKNFAIQPVEFITRNNLGFLEGCVIKRMCRWQAKDGLKDLRKAIHEIELLIEAEFEAPPEALCSAEVAEPEFPKEWPLRACTCYQKEWSVEPTCQCPPDRTGYVQKSPSPQQRAFARDMERMGAQVTGQPVLDAVNRAPAADSSIPPYAMAQGEILPGGLDNGRRILAWRPRKAGDTGTHLFGWVEVGFMWDGELVRYDAEG